MRPVPTESPWQNGMVERHGGVLQDIVRATVEELAITGLEDMKVTLQKACQSKNARIGRSGYSPQALVFGHDQRLWASGLSSWLEKPDDAALELTHTDPLYAKAYRIREAAMKAVIELDHSERWRDSLKYTSRSDGDVFFLVIKSFTGAVSAPHYRIKVVRRDYLVGGTARLS